MVYKDYLGKSYAADHSAARITKLRNDFETRVRSSFKTFSAQNDYTIRYINNEKTAHRPVIMIDGPGYDSSSLGFYKAFDLVKEAIGQPEHTSLKRLMLNAGFDEIFFLQLVKGKSVIGQWISFPLHAITGSEYEGLPWFRHIQKTIDSSVIKSLGIQIWAERFPVFYETSTVTVDYLKLVTMVEHLHDIRYFNSIALDDHSEHRLKSHLDKCGIVISESVEKIFALFSKWANLDDDKDYISSDNDTDILLAILNIKDAMVPGADKQTSQNHFSLDLHNFEDWAASLAEGLPALGALTSLLLDKYISHYSKLNE